MTTTDSRHPSPKTTPAVLDAVQRAMHTIAPSWPLDRWIAVNPYWGQRGEDIERALLQLAVAGGVPATMPRSWFRRQWIDGAFDRRHVAAALQLASGDASSVTVEAIEAALGQDDDPPEPAPLITDVADAHRPTDEPMPWASTVVDQISEHLAAWFDRGAASWRTERDQDLFAAWRTRLREDRGLPTRGDRGRLARALDDVPLEPHAVVATLAERLGLDAAMLEDYLVALLGSVRGWASWCAYLEWQTRLDGAPTTDHDAPLLQLLAIRAAWELVLLDAHELHPHVNEWRMRIAALPRERARRRRHHHVDWILQHAHELALQERLAKVICAPKPQPTTAPRIQAIFCIDVRSERFRRALERAGGDAVQTRGFAGFFGLPLAVRPFGGGEQATPHLPGLLPPSITADWIDANGDGERLADRRRRRLSADDRWQALRNAAPGAFPFVEALGLGYLPRLLRGRTGAPCTADDAGLQAGEASALRPTWPADTTAAERVAHAERVLRGIGLVDGFAPLVLLAGHGSSSTNNPQAAGLDCGACGGQRGEANARLLADLLNDADVRAGLRERGVTIPDATTFVAGLHDTTTDEVRLFAAAAPAARSQDLDELRALLAEAGRETRAERAPGLGLAELVGDPSALRAALQRRAVDWAQTRPEWGLADNAAFVVAPRAFTRGLHLDGRVFLHDYDWRHDTAFETLELILTAPMVVTNWINLQYFASTVAPEQFGSGNKLLHNVVGGDIGVLEGTGGDLRIGLARQSVHDGERLRHTPLRLSVFVAAPRAAIDDVLARNEAPRSLVENRWLHLLRVTEDRQVEQRMPDGSWVSLDDVLPEPPMPTSAPPRPNATPTPADAPARTASPRTAELLRAALPLVAVAGAIALRSLWV